MKKKDLRLLAIYLFLLIQFYSCKIDKTGDFQFYNVIKVVDGDTFWIEGDSEKPVKIRLIGIDAPESRNAFRKVVGYFGKESSNYLTSLIAEKEIRLEFDIDTLDQYGRTLAYVYLKNGIFINAEMIKKGYATLMTVPPNVKYANKFLKLEHRARKKRNGLWDESMSPD